MAKRTTEPEPKVRKLSEHIETITVKLTPREIDDQRVIVCETRDRMDALDEKLESVKAEFKGKSKDLEQIERAARTLVSTGKRDIEVLVEEYLQDGLDGVMVQKVRADTGEPIGPPRKATASEKQESLPYATSTDNGFGGS